MPLLRHLYDNLEEYTCSFLVGVMVICLLLQVIIRMTLGSSLAWTEELSRYSFIWSVYVGAALAAKRGAHVRITAQFMPLSLPWRLAFRMASDAIWIGFSLYVARIGLDVIAEGFEFPEISPTLGIVKAWVEGIIPFCFVLVSWRIVETYILHWRKGRLVDLVRYEGAA